MMPYRLVEMPFITIQGEGVMTGTPIVLIRLAGCSVQCPWCDTPESWRGDGLQLSGTEINYHARKQSGLIKWAMITGGEPVEQDLGALCLAMHDGGFNLILETSGTCPMSGAWEHIALSPKPHRPPLAEWWGMADEIKSVVSNDDEVEAALALAAEHDRVCKLILQPRWDVPESAGCCEIAAKRLGIRMSVQLHKLMGWR